jgi:hypothetical protein
MRVSALALARRVRQSLVNNRVSPSDKPGSEEVSELNQA